MVILLLLILLVLLLVAFLLLEGLGRGSPRVAGVHLPPPLLLTPLATSVMELSPPSTTWIYPSPRPCRAGLVVPPSSPPGHPSPAGKVPP